MYIIPMQFNHLNIGKREIKMPKVEIKDIDEITAEVLGKVGVDQDSIHIILETIHFANGRGVASHGVGRLPLYVKKIQSGFLNPVNEVTQVISNGGMAVYDAKNGFGQVAAYIAMKHAIQMAEMNAVSVVGVRNSNNFGMAGYFGEMAAETGKVAIICANSAPAIAPTGGSKAVFGTNPICFAMPSDKGNHPIVLDMAVTVAARGKIRLAAKEGKEIPNSWAVDEKGNATTDPLEALKGTLLPIGGYKGYGLALMVDFLAGLLTGSAYGGQVSPLSKMNTESGNGHLFIVIDIGKFLSKEEYEMKIKEFISVIKTAGKQGEVLLPGERGYLESDFHTEIVDIPQAQINEINEIAEACGINKRLYSI